MNVDRFLRIIDRLRHRRQPHGEWCFVALALFIAFLFPLVTTQTYKETFGFKPPTWEAFTLLGCLVGGTATVVVTGCWLYRKKYFPEKSSEAILAEVIHEMEGERQRAAARAEELGRISAMTTAPSTPGMASPSPSGG